VEKATPKQVRGCYPANINHTKCVETLRAVVDRLVQTYKKEDGFPPSRE